MEEEIRQQMILDAQQVLDTLLALDKAFSTFGAPLSSAVTQVNERADRIVASLERIRREAEATAEKLASIGKGSKSGGTGGSGSATPTVPSNVSQPIEEARKATDRWTMSWQTLARVIQTQAIIRGINAIRDAFEESYESNLKFSKSISEIHAVDPGRTFAQTAADVRELSDAFNQPISNVAEAQYQAISSQFVSAAERTRLLTAANALAKTTAQELSTATLLVAGALNAYGESSEMASVRAAQFFTTVRLGRVRLNELGTALGRTQSIGHELGVSMEELQAALVAITIGGVKANEASTQIRGVLSGLLKPTTDMRKALHELGVESGEDAIATWGLLGTLQQLQHVSGGSATATATLFQNIRGLAGVLRIAGEGATKYNEAMKALEAVDQATLRKTLEEFTSTDAEKTTRELNKLKNYFTVEFGADVVKMVGSMTQGMDGFIAKLRVMMGLLSTAAAPFNYVGKAIRYLGGDHGAAEAVLEEQGSYRESLDQELRMHEEQAVAAIRVEDRKHQAMLQGLRQYVAEANKVLLEQADAAKDRAKVEEQVNKLAFDRIMQGRQKLTQELFATSEAAAKKADQSIPHEIANMRQAMEDQHFDYYRSDPAHPSFYDERARYQKTLQEAIDAQSTAADAEQEKEAETLWKRVQVYRERAELAINQGNGGPWGGSIFQVRQEEERKHIEALEKQQQLQRQVSEEAEERGHQAERHNLELEEQRRRIEGLLKPTTTGAKGEVKFKSDAEWQRDKTAAETLIKGFVSDLKTYNKEDFAKNFAGDERSFAVIKREAERALASFNIQHIEAAPEALDSLQKSIREQVKQLEIKVPVLLEIEGYVGKGILEAGGANPLISDAEKNLDAESARELNRKKALADLTSADVAYSRGRSGLEARSGTAAERALATAGELSRSYGITQEDLIRLGKEGRAVEVSHEGIVGDANIWLQRFTTTMQALMARKKAQEEIEATTQPTANFDSIQKQIDALKGQTTAIEEQTSAIKRNDAAVKDATQSWQNLIGVQANGEDAQHHCSGGFIYRADGGVTRGTDTVPAMLSPGEMVINAVSSRKFASQLIAMNAGIQPAFRSQGGNTTNIGDINVSVNGGETSRQTARSIAAELRRELRRGTAVL